MLPGPRGVRPFHGGPECYLLDPQHGSYRPPWVWQPERTLAANGRSWRAYCRPAILRVVPAPTSYADIFSALDASRQARRVVGGCLPRRRAACGGPAGCWLRARQNAGGGPGLEGLARQVAGPAMPQAGRWPGRACRPGGSGSNRPGLDVGSRPWRPSWVAVRAGGQAGAEVGETSMRQPQQLYLLPPAGSSRPAGDVQPRCRFRWEYTVNLVLPLPRADRRARPAAINGPLGSFLTRRVGHPKFCGGVPCFAKDYARALWEPLT
jgi:hypothetical protein